MSNRTPGPQSPPAADAPAGLDAAKHAAAQQTAHRAKVVRRGLFPALMADALGYDKQFDSATYQVYLARLLADAGHPTDPVETMLLEQLALAHFRIGQLQARAGRAEGVEALKILSAAAARLLGEFRKTALAVRVYRVGVPGERGTGTSRLKLYKAAQ